LNDFVAAGCGNTSYYAPSGVISSPNHPKNYDNGLDCYYNIYASTGSSLLLTFKSFNVEASYDVVTVSIWWICSSYKDSRPTCYCRLCNMPVNI